MTEQELQDKIAYLESVNDQLEAELSYLDGLMRMIGFTDGLETIKETAKDIFDQNDPEFDCIEDHDEIEE